MSEMNIIMESWRGYIRESDEVEELEKQPSRVSSLFNNIKNKDIDSEQLKQIILLLAKDSEIQQAAQFFKDSLEGNVQAEGLLDKIGAQAYVKIDRLKDAMLSTPTGKKILNHPATTLALGFLVFKAASEGFDVSSLSDPETIQTASEVLLKGKNIKFEDIVDIGIDSISELLSPNEVNR